MSFSSLYQKYRPHNFKEIIGQDYVIKTLVNTIKLNRIGHAYIFSGPKGIGKTTIAKIFSKAINCENFKDDICNKCESCLTISKNSSTDILELDAASNNSVDDIRNIIDSVRFLPSQLKYKVYIIDEAHMLSNSAWNALLKTLEEPPKYAVFIFATTEIQKIPSTILSRCQCFEFSRLIDKQINELISLVCQKEEIKIDQPSIQSIINLANGSARDSLSILEQVSLYSNRNINIEAINTLFGLIDINQKLYLINCFKSKKINEVLSKIQEFEDKGVNFNQLILDIANIFTDALIYNQTNNMNLLKALNVGNIKQIPFDYSQLIKLINLCQASYNAIKTLDNPCFNFKIFIFSVFDLLTNNQENNNVEVVSNDVKKQTNNEIKIDKPKVSLINDITQPNFNIDKIVKTKTISFSKPSKKQTVSQKINTNKIETISYEDVFISIIKNADKTSTKEAKSIFEIIKENVNLYEELSSFYNSVNVALACKNGMIVVYDDQLDADSLNSNFDSTSLQKIFIKLFNKPFYVLGGDKNYIKSLIHKANTIKDNINEPDLDYLRKKIRNADPINAMAMEIFGEE